MDVNREAEILEELNGLKWPDQFICLKCGNKVPIKGDEPFSKKCSKSTCKRNVSLKMYTAFEGLRFPMEKAYGILEAIIEGAYLDPNKKVYPITMSKNEKKRAHEEGEIITPYDSFSVDNNTDESVRYLSMSELVEYSKTKKTWHPDKIDELLQKIINDSKPTIASLSRQFGIEENTVKKFIERVNNRLVPHYKMELKDPLWRLLQYVEDNRSVYTLSYLLGMAMVPMVGKWNLGRIRINNTNYCIRPIPGYEDGPWSVYRTVITLKDDKYDFDYKEEIRCGSDEWYNLFHAFVDK